MNGRVVATLLLLAQAMTAQVPVILPDRVLNAASFAQLREPGHAVAPGSLVSIFGQFYAPAWQVAEGIPLPGDLGGLSVRFNGRSAPLTFISAEQINAQVPWDVVSMLPPGSNEQMEVVVIRNGLPSATERVELARFSPGIFALNGRLAVAVNATDGTIAQPPGSIPGLNTHGAAIGSAIIVYANGLGPVDKEVASGDVGSDPITRTLTEPTVLIGGVEATVLFSGLAPQFVGVNQLNVAIPPNAPVGDAVPLQIRIGGITTSEAITIAVSR
jgi:uncharacterized protein (TIGR03437 family)